MSESTHNLPMTIRYPLRVRYPECDQMGVVHHSVYIIWMEAARIELLRQQGAVYSEVEKQGYLFMVAKLATRYRKPAYFDDDIIVEITAEPCAGIKIDHRYKIFRKTETGDEVLCVTGETTVVCATPEGKAQRIPDGMVP